MLSEREKRMATILQRLAEWNTQMLDDTPINVLKGIVRDSEDLLEDLGLPMFPERTESPTAPASESSGETCEPSKSLLPGDH
jgi:hypothetical protein